MRKKMDFVMAYAQMEPLGPRIIRFGTGIAYDAGIDKTGEK
jgi:hypothetical protein